MRAQTPLLVPPGRRRCLQGSEPVCTYYNTASCNNLLLPQLFKMFREDSTKHSELIESGSCRIDIKTAAAIAPVTIDAINV